MKILYDFPFIFIKVYIGLQDLILEVKLLGQIEFAFAANIFRKHSI